MPTYEQQVKRFIRNNFTEETQKRAVIAIEDLLLDGKDWEWIFTALKKKSVDNWERWGFGLAFNPNFNGSVLQQIERNREAELIDLEEYFADMEEGGEDE